MRRLKRWVVGLLVAVGLWPAVASATPELPDFAMPAVVDWSQVVTVVAAYVGAALVIIMGCVLAFTVAKRLIRRLGRVA